jgi:hypothetical protein
VVKVVKQIYIYLAITVLFFVGCGSEKKDSTVKMKEINYLIPDGVDFSRSKGSDAYLMSLKDTQEVAGFVQEVGLAKESTKNVSTLRSAKILQKSIDSAYNSLQRDNTIVSNVSLLSSQSLQSPYAYTIAHYQLRTYNDMQPMELAGDLVGIITKKNLENKPKTKKETITARNFRLVVIYGDLNGSTYYLISVVPDNIYDTHEGKISEIMNGARVSNKGIKLHSKSEKFVVKSSNKKVDFLFVVDDSGSMSNDQQALSRAALDFTKEISNSGLSYRSSIITTSDGIQNIDGDANRILKDVGIIKNDDTLLQSKLVAGSNGSSTETGIWNAERALQSKTLGDSSNGVVTALGMPQKDTSMSVIIISDEPSQYTSRSSKSFDTAKNLFTNRKIKVYTIIDTSDNTHSQYDELSMATSAMYADINNKDLDGTLNFTIIMKQIAQDAGGIASLVTLAHSAAEIDKVQIDGKTIPYDTVKGYTYIQASKSIIFHGIEFSEKSKKITITVKYKYYQ